VKVSYSAAAELPISSRMIATSSKHWVFDIETTPIDTTDRRKLPRTIHCIVIADVHTGEVIEFGPGEIELGIKALRLAQRLIGHDIARFDIPVLEQYSASWDWQGEIFDTHSVSRLVYASNMEERSWAYRRKEGGTEEQQEARLPKRLVDKHKLEAWGYRLGIPKQHADVELSFFERWSPELQERCVSDVRINLALYQYLLTRSADHRKGWPLCSEASMLNESRVAYIVGQQERNGVGFDRAGAGALLGVLQAERQELEGKLQSAVESWLAPAGPPVNPKRSRVMRKGLRWPVHYEAGAEYQPIERVFFSASSAQQRWLVLEGRAERQRRLMKPFPVYGPIGYGWRADEFTNHGQAITDEETLAGLPYPIIPDLLAYMTVCKRLGQLSDGNQAWLKHEVSGRIHGGVLPTGTRTSRAAHFRPNLGQVPKCSSPYGPECRALFKPTRPGWLQVGVDAQGLELRMLAHRLFPYDKGVFAKAILEGGDVHSLWMQGTGIRIRDNQKTWTYAFLYGAGDKKLGEIILEDKRMSGAEPPTKSAQQLGSDSRKKFLRHFKALDHLLEECYANQQRGWFPALDGRVLACPSEHGALNDLLQSDGAILVKHAMPRWHQELCLSVGKPGENWAPMLWVHDEHQLEAKPEIGPYCGTVVSEAITWAGEKLGLNCRMDGAYKVGRNWSETH
jgi:DNA polymerase I